MEKLLKLKMDGSGTDSINRQFYDQYSHFRLIYSILFSNEIYGDIYQVGAFGPALHEYCYS